MGHVPNQEPIGYVSKAPREAHFGAGPVLRGFRDPQVHRAFIVSPGIRWIVKVLSSTQAWRIADSPLVSAKPNGDRWRLLATGHHRNCGDIAASGRQGVHDARASIARFH